MKTRTLLALPIAMIVAGAAAFAQPVINPRTVTVSLGGSGADFSSLAAAVGYVNSLTPPPSASNRFVILVYPGIYTGPDNVFIIWPSYVSLRGVDRKSTIIRGSTSPCGGPEIPLLDIQGKVGVEIGNITLDGSAQMNAPQCSPGYQAGATQVCAAQVSFNDVTYINASGGIASGASLVAGPGCSSGDIMIRNSDMAPIYDFGGNWTISGSRFSATSAQPAGGDELLYAYIHAPSAAGSSKVFITGSTIETIARSGDGLIDNYPLYIQGRGDDVHIIGSTIRARTEATSPGYDTAAVFLDSGLDVGTGSVVIEGSLIQYESVTGATGGTFFGVRTEFRNGPGAVSGLEIRGSTIRSVGSGGTRADVQNETSTLVTLAGTQYATAGGPGLAQILTSDLRQGQFSADLTIPVSTPVVTPVPNGRLWIDASNRLCYRSSGSTRCLAGGVFMKVSKIGASSAPGNMTCVTAGNKRLAWAYVTIVNRDNGSPIAGATVTGNWSGATTQNGVTGVTNESGVFIFVSNQANPGGVFTFTVTNVTHSPDFYDATANLETSDSTPVCN